jgi:DNA-binding FadR family transcriptional regulator
MNTTKYDKITNHLIDDVLQERYRAGERLPSERDLALRFDANRGAVREAMKRLGQLGLADVKPGGARVKDRAEASLDIISHLLKQGPLPDRNLVDQVLVVISSLVLIAAEQLVRTDNEDDIESVRAQVKLIYQRDLTIEDHTVARIDLMNMIMQSSHNLPLQIIARTLFEQFAPNVEPLSRFAEVDTKRWANSAEKLDHALADRDLSSIREAFDAMSKLNRETTVKAFDHFQSLHGQEVSSS